MKAKRMSYFLISKSFVEWTGLVSIYVDTIILERNATKINLLCCFMFSEWDLVRTSWSWISHQFSIHFFFYITKVNHSLPYYVYMKTTRNKITYLPIFPHSAKSPMFQFLPSFYSSDLGIFYKIIVFHFIVWIF